tara:strand:- start:258 stop:746 length:489 start_codon:yes stop_codon:yes gene_type:complete
MVKNTTGGSKHKGQARKLVNAPVSNKIRFSEDDDECYAIVSKMLGNGMCHVNVLKDNDILENIICHIRGKFRSRNKKSNLVSVGGVILVGLRSWTSSIDACDLLSIYPDHHISSLNLPSSLLNSIQNFSSNDQSFLFSNSSFHDNSFNSVSPSFDHVDLDNI